MWYFQKLFSGFQSRLQTTRWVTILGQIVLRKGGMMKTKIAIIDVGIQSKQSTQNKARNKRSREEEQRNAKRFFMWFDQNVPMSTTAFFEYFWAGSSFLK